MVDLAPVLPPLWTCARDIERYVAAEGWDQPARLFAIVTTERLRAEQPQLADALAEDTDPVGLSAIEQEDLPGGGDLGRMLAQIAWPPQVDGAALAVERIVLPPGAEVAPGEQGAAIAAAHPDRTEVRLLVAVLRDGSSVCLLRQRQHDHDDEVAIGADIAPGLAQALAATFSDEV